MLKEKDRNPGGITGSGKGRPDTHSEEFKALRQAIESDAGQRSPLQRAEDELAAIRYRLEDYLRSPLQGEAIPAGAFLRDCLRAVGIKHKDFARYIGVEESNLSALFSGRRKLNLDLAIKLHEIFHIGPLLWLQVQARSELAKLGPTKRDANQRRYSLEELMERAG